MNEEEEEVRSGEVANFMEIGVESQVSTTQPGCRSLSEVVRWCHSEETFTVSDRNIRLPCRMQERERKTSQKLTSESQSFCKR